MNWPRNSLIAFASAVLACCLPPSVAQPHGIPLDLAFWGPFSPSSVHCQRMLGRAAQSCFGQVLSAQRRCMDTQLADGQCDTSERDVNVGAAQRAGQAVPTAECFGGQLTELRFNSFDETAADVLRGCAQAGPVLSMIYAPAQAGGSTTSVDATAGQCMTRVSSLSQLFARVIMRLNTAALDHIAVNIVAPSQKNALMARVGTRIAAAQRQMAARLAQVCPDFTVVYGQDETTFLTALRARTDCVLAATYVQNAIVCNPICGDGVTEPGEQCDDGNTIDTDACHNNCTSNF